MSILDNKSQKNTRIVYEAGYYEIKSKALIDKTVDGIGILTEKDELLGIFFQEEQMYFIYNDEITNVDKETFTIVNKYISDKERLFEVFNKDESICAIRYIPYVDPGMIIYGADEDEFDDLLRFSNIFKNSNAITNLIRYIKYLNQ